jgi:hypothetical protein
VPELGLRLEELRVLFKRAAHHLGVQILQP